MQKSFTHILLGIVAVILLLSSCGPKELPEVPDGTIKLNFRAVYDTTAVIMGDRNQIFNHLGDEIQFDELRFFVSNVALKNTGSQNQREIIGKNSVELIDLTDRNNPERARAGKSLFKPIQLGNFEGIRLDFGVPPSLNMPTFDPNMYEGSNDLNDPSIHSESMKSYIFLEVKGFLPRVGNFDLIIGTDKLYMENKIFDKPVIVSDLDEDIKFNFVIDLKKVLAGLKVSQHRVITSGNLMEIGGRVMDNLVEKGIELGEEE